MTELHDHEAERKLIGYLLSYAEHYPDVAQAVKAEALNLRRCRAVYNAMSTLFMGGHSVDIVNLAEYMQDKSKDDWMAFLTECLTDGIGAFDWQYLAQRINDLAQRRRMQDIAVRLGAGAATEDLQALVNEVATDLLYMTENENSRGITLTEAMLAYNMTLDDGIEGVEIPFAPLARILGMHEPSTLTIEAARPGTGKSAHAMCEAIQVAAMGKKVLYFSIEMAGEEFAARRLTGSTGVSKNKLSEYKRDKGVPQSVKDAFVERANQWAEKIADRLVIYDSPLVTTADIYARALAGKPDILYVDHIGLCADKPNGTDYERLSYISWQLKVIAKRLKIPVIGLCQLSRKLESRENKKPILSDLRDSGKIEENADRVVFLHRQDLFDRVYGDESKTEFIIAKNRGGRLGETALTYDMAAQWFEELRTNEAAAHWSA